MPLTTQIRPFALSGQTAYMPTVAEHKFRATLKGEFLSFFPINVDGGNG